jgi:branched-chain amino acid transport system substrate-binding protein
MRWQWRAVSGVIACCLAAACGGPSDEAARRAAACHEPGVTADSIKIGQIFPDSGLLAPLFRASRSGVTARVGEVNAAGGIHGRKIDLDWQSDDSDATANLQAARVLVERRDVFGLIETTGYATGSAQYLNQRGVPVTGNTLEPVWSRYKNMFSYAYRVTLGGSVTTWGAFAKAHGGTRAVVVESKLSEATVNVGDKIADSLRAAGIDVVDTLDYTPGVTSLDLFGRQILALRPDVLTGALPANQFAAVQVAATGAGLRPNVIMSPTGYDPNILHQYGPQVAGTYYFIPYIPFEANTPAHARFRQSMARYAPELQPADQEIALLGYISADLFLRGLDLAGDCPSRAAFIDKLRAVHDYTGADLMPRPVDLTQIGQLNPCYHFVRVKADGTGYEMVQGAKPLCGRRLPVSTTGAGGATPAG